MIAHCIVRLNQCRSVRTAVRFEILEDLLPGVAVDEMPDYQSHGIATVVELERRLGAKRPHCRLPPITSNDHRMAP